MQNLGGRQSVLWGIRKLSMESTTPGRIVNTSEKEYRYTAIAKNREAEKCLRVLRANSALVTSRKSLETQLTENFVEIVTSPG